MTYQAFNALPVSTLRGLADSLRDGVLSVALTRSALEQLAGPLVADVTTSIQRLRSRGMSHQQVADVVEAIAETRECIPDPNLVFELVISGPSVVNVPTQDTFAVVRTLFTEASREVLLSGYTVFNGAEIFAPLHARMIENPALAVRLLLDIARRDHVAPRDVVTEFASSFNARHWPWPEKPELHFYPRSMETEASDRGSLHAKCIIVDRAVALVTSANYTAAAQQRNIEVGMLTRFEPLISRLAGYFQGLVESGRLERVSLD